jgi:hypothetical protein
MSLPDEQRGFNCRVQEGTYKGDFEVWVNADSIEKFGNEAIESAARKQLRSIFGLPIGLAYVKISILNEIYNA